MKKLRNILMPILVGVLLLGTAAFASETCDYADDGVECEIWYFSNEESHWRACVNHDDIYGNDAAVSEEEPHEFVDGKCVVCDMEEIKGSETMYYIMVFVIVGVAGLWASARARSTFKNAKLEQTPFGLDKFKKR